MRRRIALIGIAAATALPLLSACAGLDSAAVEVVSQGSWPADRRAGSYAIERLPSQQAQPAEQERVEAAALGALQAAGFTPAPREEADVLIQLGARVFTVAHRSAYADAPLYWRNDWWYRGPHWPYFWGTPYGPWYADEVPDHQREVAVLIRDRRSQQIIYEARGRYTSRWNDERLLPAMFEAVLKDFPLTASAPRTVTVVLPPR